MKIKKSYTKTVIMRGMKLLHFVACFVVFSLCWQFFYSVNSDHSILLRYDVLMCCFFSACTVIFNRIYQSYSVGFDRISNLVYSQTLSNLLSYGIVYVFHCIIWFQFFTPLMLLAAFSLQIILNFVWCFLANRLYFSLHAKKKAILVYRNANDLEKLQEVRFFTDRFSVEKCIEINTESYGEIVSLIEGYEAVFVAGVNATLRNSIVKYCVENNVQGYFVPHVGDIIMMGANHIQQFSIPIMSVRRARLTPEYLILKRFVDIFVCGIATVIFSPVMLIVALSVKLYDGGPIFYKQVRLTKDGKKFKILKFRSMRVDAEKDGIARLASEKDDRITPIGKILRACRLDELPQLFNILKGDMTIVGPRPERPEIAEQYEEIIPSFPLRLQVKAGLTGYAQIYGKYNTAPYDKLEMDLMYINKMSFFEDLKLMFATVKILFIKDSTSGVEVGQTTAVSKASKRKEEKNKI